MPPIPCPTLTYGSLCSGISGESVAWKPLGWGCLFFSEIEPFCRSLLRKRYPDISNLGDISHIERENISKVPDVLIAGTPCQSFSINSRGNGLVDRRGNLTLEYLRIVGEVQSRWIIWENVPGVLSANKGRDFSTITCILGKYGYGWAYRVLDLRGFGIPHRRRRLFLVGFRGDYRFALATLANCSAVSKDSRQAEKAQNGQVVGTEQGRIDGWAGDETPKRSDRCIPTLRHAQGGEGVGVIQYGMLRTLTLTEWERLMGFPDGYTRVFHQGSIATSRMRREVLGNSFPPPILQWVGRRIQAISGLV